MAKVWIMQPEFQTVFDLTGQPDLIHPPYWFLAIFLVVGIFLSIFAWLAVKKRWRLRRSLPLIAIGWVVIWVYAVVAEFRGAAAIRDAVVSGHVEVAEGCLDYFRPGAASGSKTTAGNEMWSVGGLAFSYGSGEVRPAFHAVSTAGGPVRADARARVFFVMNPEHGRREIVRLDLAPHACPRARHIEPYAEP